MRFEVLYHGVVKMFTESEKCIPDKELLKEMKKNGYEFKKDGKPYKIPQNNGISETKSKSPQP